MTKTIAGGGTAELEVGKVYLDEYGRAHRIKKWSEAFACFVTDTGLFFYYTGYPENRTGRGLIQELEPQCDTPPK